MGICLFSRTLIKILPAFETDKEAHSAEPSSLSQLDAREAAFMLGSQQEGQLGRMLHSFLVIHTFLVVLYRRTLPGPLSFQLRAAGPVLHYGHSSLCVVDSLKLRPLGRGNSCFSQVKAITFSLVFRGLTTGAITVFLPALTWFRQ